MKSHVSGQATTAIVAPTLHLGALRRAIMAALSADVFTPAECLQANHSVYECEDAARLALWLKNVRRVFAEREAEAEAQALANMAHGIARFEARVAEAQHTAPVQYATAAQKEEITRLCNSLYILRKEKTAALLKLPHLDEPQAVALIGELWAKMLRRQERVAEGHESASDSFSIAA